MPRDPDRTYCQISPKHPFLAIGSASDILSGNLPDLYVVFPIHWEKFRFYDDVIIEYPYFGRQGQCIDLVPIAAQSISEERYAQDY